MQGLYPPSISATSQTLANGTTESDPLDGYQYVPLNGLPSTAPDTIWIAGDQSCPAVTIASRNYYNSTKFLTMQAQLQPFYNKFKPLLAGIFNDSQIGFQTAFNIFDYLNVGYIHNSTIFANLSSDDLFQLRTLADSQSFDLVYNTSSPNTSIGGKTLAYLILSHLNQTASQSTPGLKITYFAGAYTVMLPFWALSGLPQASSDFYGLPDYASAMAFELRQQKGSSELTVRFGFRNGSAPLNYFPMFGSNDTDMPWSQWSEAMMNISITSVGSWCNICNSTLTFCSGYASTNTQSGSSAGSTAMSCGLSAAAGGGIGASVAIGVIALIEGAIALWYFRSRNRGASAEKASNDSGSVQQTVP